MAGTINYNNGVLTNLLDNTGTSPNTLSALGPNQACIMTSGNAYVNANGYFWADFELLIWPSAATIPVQGGTFDLYLMNSVNSDGIFPDCSGGTNVPVPINSYVGSFTTRTVPGPQRISLRSIPLPPTEFIAMVYNNTTVVTMPTNSGAQVLRMITYGEAYT